MEGFTATAIVLVNRGAGELPALKASTDQSITTLTHLSRLHDTAMVI
jgi:hypothetical protein